MSVTRSASAPIPEGKDGAEEEKQTDAQWIADMHAHGSRAFESLVRRHSPKLLGYLSRFLGDDHEAEDVAQETWEKVWTHVWQGEEDHFSRWLYRVAHNVAVSHIRGRGRRPAISLDACGGYDSPPAGPQEAEVDPAAMEALHRAVARLSILQREAVQLVFFEGLTHVMAAKRIGIRQPTLSTRVERGRRSLKQLLHAEGIVP